MMRRASRLLAGLLGAHARDPLEPPGLLLHQPVELVVAVGDRLLARGEIVLVLLEVAVLLLDQLDPAIERDFLLLERALRRHQCLAARRVLALDLLAEAQRLLLALEHRGAAGGLGVTGSVGQDLLGLAFGAAEHRGRTTLAHQVPGRKRHDGTDHDAADPHRQVHVLSRRRGTRRTRRRPPEPPQAGKSNLPAPSIGSIPTGPKSGVRRRRPPTVPIDLNQWFKNFRTSRARQGDPIERSGRPSARHLFFVIAIRRPEEPPPGPRSERGPGRPACHSTADRRPGATHAP